MSTDLQEALRRAEQAGSASFELRDVTEVIRPATRRVKRQRALTGSAGALGAMAIIAGSWWGLGVVEQSRNFAEAGAEADGGGTALTAFDGTTPSPAAEAAGGPSVPTIEALLAAATPRTLGEEATGRSAAIACDSQEDPLRTTQESAVSSATAITDCVPVWVDGTVRLDITGQTSVAFDQAAGTVTVAWELVNSGTVPLWLYADPYGTIQTNPLSLAADDVSVDGLAVSATTVWTAADSQIGLMNSKNKAHALAPGEMVRGTLVWNAAAGDDVNQIDHILAGDSTFFFTINPRLAQVGYTAPTPLILEVGSADFSYLTTPTFESSGSDVRDGETETVVGG